MSYLLGTPLRTCFLHIARTCHFASNNSHTVGFTFSNQRSACLSHWAQYWALYLFKGHYTSHKHCSNKRMDTGQQELPRMSGELVGADLHSLWQGRNWPVAAVSAGATDLAACENQRKLRRRQGGELVGVRLAFTVTGKELLASSCTTSCRCNCVTAKQLI